MQIPLIWIYFAAGFAAALLVMLLLLLFVQRSQRNRFEEQIAEIATQTRERIEELEGRLADAQKEAETLQLLLQESRVENAGLHERVEALKSLEVSMEELETKLEDERSRNVALEKEVSELHTRLEEERRQAEKSLRELKEAKETMQKEFKVLAAQIMEENSRRFGDLSKERVEAVLKPLQMQVTEFRKRVEQVHTEETKNVSTLLNEIKHLKELNMKISEDAVNLTKALRGESKTQGIWGEMVLERVLEASGLREGEEYEREVSLKDAESRRFRPDVVVHLPDDRDIVIDAKTSLVAYERYVSAETDEEKKRYEAEHLAAVRAHVERLSDKSYTRLEGVNTLDFIFMFMPIEGALMLALQSDPTLYDRAFAKHIVLVSPTTLLVALRAVENTWRHDRQNRNALKIAEQAGNLYDKFVGFARDLEKLGSQIETVRKTYDGAWSKLTSGRGNLVRQVETLRELGAKASKQMPKKTADDAEVEPKSCSSQHAICTDHQ